MLAMARMKSVQGKHYDSPLARNLRRLIERQAEGSVNAWVARFGGDLKQTTINRISNGSADASISVLLQIADKTGHAPWQLLHPDFDPRQMPPLADQRTMRIAAIFAGIREEKDRRMAEAIMEQFAGDGQAAVEEEPTRPRSRSR